MHTYGMTFQYLCGLEQADFIRVQCVCLFVCAIDRRAVEPKERADHKLRRIVLLERHLRSETRAVEQPPPRTKIISNTEG